MGIFERYLTLWVGLCILVGLRWATSFPPVPADCQFRIRARQPRGGITHLGHDLPMMVQIDFSAIRDVGKKPKGIMLTLGVNWLIKPFTMAALGWLFFRVIFVDWVDPQSATEYIAGMILLGVAPCTAMVFVWSQLTRGDPNYTLVQVAANDIVMIFAFAPIAAFLLGVSDIEVPWETLLFSVVFYVLLPLIAGAFTRHQLETGGDGHRVDTFIHALKPWSVIGLLGTVVLLFGFQAEKIIGQPQTILLIAVPLLIQTYGIFAIGYAGARALRLPHNIAGARLPDRRVQLL